MLVKINSIFQVVSRYGEDNFWKLLNCDFRHPVSPRVFANSRIGRLTISGMYNYFLQRNMLSFVNETIIDRPKSLNANIHTVYLIRVENMILDLRFFNPLVFKQLVFIQIMERFVRIEPDVFQNLKRLRKLEMNARHYCNPIRRHGIAWIRSINSDLNVNLSNKTDVLEHMVKRYFQLQLRVLYNKTVRDYFPDEDFCLYGQFPFGQLVVFTLNFESHVIKSLFIGSFDPNEWVGKLTCTFEWLIRYFPTILSYFDDSSTIINSSSSSPTCDFVKMQAKCDKWTFSKRIL